MNTLDKAINMLDKRTIGHDMTYSQVYEYFKNKYGNIRTKQSISSSGQIITFLSGRKEVGYFSRTKESNISSLPEKGSAYEY